MSQLACKTRGNTGPQGKPRVYFCCHPADFPLYFEAVAEELLALQNCAIFYPRGGEAVYDEELLRDLTQMQLFVMPVTHRLLTGKNSALTVAFPFAIAHHIPVLPLMQESGLDALFNKKCGELQYLDKYAADSTAIPYEEKLRAYLDSVLIGDELAEKVRAAFDAYVFLSYRKKDRQYAQELMRLIHRIPFCRDIAIWYDEFLTPGENFNDAIRQALEKSGLFVLAVTPNLVNEPNYIQEIEYPMARKQGKPILPAEMVPTDAKKLARKYKHIPPCTDARNSHGLSAALLQALQSVAIRENDHSPEHNFFIGLAYLGGIDVEVDHERAVALITSAADAGLTEAIEKLISMYESGVGVPRDYTAVVDWRRKLVQKREEQYAAAPGEDTVRPLLSALWKLGDALRELYRQDDAYAIYRQMEGLCNTYRETYGYCRNVERYLAVAYNLLGDISRDKSDVAGALAWQRQSLTVRERLAEERRSVRARRDLALAYERMGNMESDQGHPQAALEWHHKQRELTEKLLQQENTPRHRRNLFICYQKLGTVTVDLGNLAAAREWFVKALAIAEALMAENDTPEACRSVAICYEKLGGLDRSRGDLTAARGWFEKALVLREKQAQELGTPRTRRPLSIVYRYMGEIESDHKRFGRAREWHEKELALLQEILEEVDTFDIQRDLSVSYGYMGSVCESQKDYAAARVWYEKALPIREQLLEEAPSLQGRRDLSVSYGNMGLVCKRLKDYAAAWTWYEKAFMLREAIAKETGTVEARQDLAFAYNRLGEICQATDDQVGAAVWYERALAIRQQLATEVDTPGARRSLAVCYRNMGDVCEKQGDNAGALDWLMRSLPLWERLVAAHGMVDDRNDLAAMYRRLSRVDAGKKRQYLEAARDLWTALMADYPGDMNFPKRKKLCDDALAEMA